MLAPISCYEETINLVESAATNLGVAVNLHKVAINRISSHPYFCIFAAVTEHKQAMSYPVSRHYYYRDRLISTPSNLPELQNFELQRYVNNDLLGNQPGLWFYFFDESGSLIERTSTLGAETLWTLHYSITDIYENAVRTIHDLPLGNCASWTSQWATLTYQAPTHLDMQKPYLHLFAHNPNYKLHRFSSHHGFISVSGDGNLIEEITHAVDYLEGIVNE